MILARSRRIVSSLSPPSLQPPQPRSRAPAALLRTMPLPSPLPDLSALAFTDQIAHVSDRVDLIAQIGYDGRGFLGFQQQPAFSDKTVEEQLLKALTAYFFPPSPSPSSACVPRKPIRLNAVSRTDAEVSAKSQLVRFTVPAEVLLRLASSVPPTTTPATPTSGGAAAAEGAERDAAVASRIRADVNAMLAAASWPIKINRLRFAICSQVRLRQTVLRKHYSYWLLPMPKKDKEAFAVVSRLKGKLGQVYKPALLPLNLEAMRAALNDLEGQHCFKFLALPKRASPSHDRWMTERVATKGATVGKDQELAGDTDAGGDSESDSDGDFRGDGAGDGDGDDVSSPEEGRQIPVTGDASGDGLGAENPWERFSWFLGENSASTVRYVDSARMELVPLRHVNTDPSEELTPEGPYPELLTHDGPSAYGPTVAVKGEDGAATTTTEPVVLRFRFVAEGFLRHQLRIIVGLLIKIGEGTLPADSFKRLLDVADAEARERLGEMLEAKKARMEGKPVPPRKAAVAFPPADKGLSDDSELNRGVIKILGLKTVPKAPGLALVLEKLETPAELWTDRFFTNSLHKKFLADWPFLRVHSNARNYRSYRIDGRSAGSATGKEQGREKSE